jgi:hypothetical protein
VKKLFGIFIVSLSVAGCTPLPKVQVSGPHLQIYFSDLPVLQITNSSSAKCEQIANAEMQSLNVDSRRMVAQGKMRITCSNISQSNQLEYSAMITEILTNVKSEARFQSKEACVLLAPSLGKAFKLNC